MNDISPHPLQARVSALKIRHQEIKDNIMKLENSRMFDGLAVMRFKKKKLHLKDTIQKLENEMLPDIIA